MCVYKLNTITVSDVYNIPQTVRRNLYNNNVTYVEYTSMTSLPRAHDDTHMYTMRCQLQVRAEFDTHNNIISYVPSDT